MRIVSPIPSASSVPSPTADFSEPDHFVPASVTPEVQRIGDPLGEQAVGGDRVRARCRLHRDLEVREVQPLHQLDRLDRGGHERLDGVLVLELAQVLGQRAGVDADAQRRAVPLGQRDHLGDLVGPADVAGVQPHAVRARVDRLQRERVVEVDVGDHRDRRLARRSFVSASASCSRGTATRTMSAPASATVRIWSIVAARFAVSVLVIVCTATGRAAADRDGADVDLPLGSHSLILRCPTSTPPRTARSRDWPRRWPPARGPVATSVSSRSHILPEGARVLDVGCGALGLRALEPELDITGVDLAERPDYPGPFVRADAAAGLPFAEDEFDLVYCSSVIEHVPPPAPRGVRRGDPPGRPRLVRADPRLLVPARAPLAAAVRALAPAARARPLLAAGRGRATGRRSSCCGAPRWNRCSGLRSPSA